MNAYNPPIREFVETEDERIERLREEAWQELRDECFEEFNDWVRAGIRGLRECDNNPREEEDFDRWLERQAVREGGKYLEALDYMERRAIGRAA